MILGWRHWLVALLIALLLHVALLAIRWQWVSSQPSESVVTLDLQPPTDLPEPVPVALTSAMAFAWQLGAIPETTAPPDVEVTPRAAGTRGLSSTLGGESLGLDALVQPGVSASTGPADQPADQPVDAPATVADAATQATTRSSTTPATQPATRPQSEAPRVAATVSPRSTPSTPSSQPESTAEPPADSAAAGPAGQTRLIDPERERREQAERDRREAEQRQQQELADARRREAERRAAEQAEQAERERQAREQAELERQARQQAERERQAREQAAAEQRAREQAERERAEIAAARAAAERARQQAEQAQRAEQAERDAQTRRQADTTTPTPSAGEAPDLDAAIARALQDTPTVAPVPENTEIAASQTRDRGDGRDDVDRAIDDTLSSLSRVQSQPPPPRPLRFPKPDIAPESPPASREPSREAQIARALSGVESRFGPSQPSQSSQPPADAPQLPPPLPPSSRTAQPPSGQGRAPIERASPPPAGRASTSEVRRGYNPQGRPGAFSLHADDFFSRLADHIFQANDQAVGPLPPDARRLVLDVRFTIDRQGRVMDVSLVSSSGDPAMDQAARDVIWRASPMPQMARDMANETMELTFPVVVAR